MFPWASGGNTFTIWSTHSLALCVFLLKCSINNAVDTLALNSQISSVTPAQIKLCHTVLCEAHHSLLVVRSTRHYLSTIYGVVLNRKISTNYPANKGNFSIACECCKQEGGFAGNLCTRRPKSSPQLWEWLWKGWNRIWVSQVNFNQ
jgi:hypothetical protein